MEHYHLKSLERQAYIASTALIQDPGTLRFADQSLAWWDRHFSWKAHGCSVLCDTEENHLCYLFFRIDRYGEYLTLYNLFTPAAERRKGHATRLLRLILAEAVEKHVRRITFSSVTSSLDFYAVLGFIYWGINDIGDYYCNLPLPKEGLDGITAMTRIPNTADLLGSYIVPIHAKVDGNERYLTPAQDLIHQANVLKLGKSYVKDTIEKKGNAL